MRSRNVVTAAGSGRVLGMVALLVLGGCGGGSQDPAPLRIEQGTPIVLISIDTLRSDRLPAYGYAAGDTPAIDALRADGILFERAYAPAPLTLPSHASLLTGLLPPDHGVRDNLGYTVDGDRTPMLQQRLKAAGYATGGAVSAYVLRRATGIAAGFDVWDDAMEVDPRGGLQQVQRAGPETLKAILPWLGSVAEQPFFLLLHLFEPHTPYDPPAPFAARFASPYDGEVAAADAVVGELIAELRRLRVYDRACIVLLSDHGEGLGEHGEEEHGLFLYRTTLQVPLILKLPGQARAGATVSSPVGLVDVLPTLLSALELAMPEGIAGAPLFDLPRPDSALYAETLYPRLHFGWADLASLIDGDHHYIAAPTPELYDLARDPDELTNLALDEPDLVAELARALAGIDRRLVAPQAVDAEDRQRLQALGYLGGGSATTASDDDLPDPKSRVHVLADLAAARRALASGDLASAHGLLAPIVVDNPHLVDAWQALAEVEERRGRPHEALATCRRGLASNPNARTLALRAARLMLAQGELVEAAAHAELAIVEDPTAAHGLLARIALAENRLDRAEEQSRAAVASDPQRPEPWLLLAEVLRLDGRLPEAVELLVRAATESVAAESGRRSLAAALLRLGRPEEALAAMRGLEGSEDPGTLVLLARVAAMLQRPDEARRRLDRALELAPGHPESLVSLGILDLTQQRFDDAERRLEQGLAADPSLAEGWNALGAVRAQRGDDPGAIAAWEKALEAEPRLHQLLYNLAMANARLGRFSAAVRAMESFAATLEGEPRERALALARSLRAELGGGGGR